MGGSAGPCGVGVMYFWKSGAGKGMAGRITRQGSLFGTMVLSHRANRQPSLCYGNIPTTFGVHSSTNGLDFSKNPEFGFQGEAFTAQFGDMSPVAGKVLYPVGFKIVRVNIDTGVVRDFAANKSKRNGPASWLGKGGFERPLSVKFDRSGSALYVVDFGMLKTDREGSYP